MQEIFLLKTFFYWLPACLGSFINCHLIHILFQHCAHYTPKETSIFYKSGMTCHVNNAQTTNYQSKAEHTVKLLNSFLEHNFQWLHIIASSGYNLHHCSSPSLCCVSSSLVILSVHVFLKFIFSYSFPYVFQSMSHL